MKPTTTRYLDGEVHAYQVSGGVGGPLEQVATYRIEAADEILDHAVAPDLSRAAYTTCNSVVCIGQDGHVLWRYDLEPRSTQRYGFTPSCDFSLDGAGLWVYRPDTMADRGDHDMLMVLHADTGEVVAEADLDTTGHGVQHVQHPDGRHVLLEVGEGQDGVHIFRAALTGDGLDLHSYGWIDRCLVDVAPDGRWFMTVHHGQMGLTDVAFHAFPDGEVVLCLPVAAFGYQGSEAFIHWSGGFLDADMAIVTTIGKADDQEWRHHHRVDLRTGAPLGRFEPHCRHGYDFKPLGDGTWIASDPDGNPVRRSLSLDL
ncbi:hypothetical protein B0J13DRAFT_570171 [Dactylonectria estremocensis]|uniref:Uncharacterized protein n=1 Tax=Dactylonectria estremocensis TaxID=1079267 RepID=A0A9P9CXC7_9HYPO|nr:hypothetical protein B0J13DRAFT_579519 [Dactylonectria estremocensis]KAH7118296.1 hypothetical protein B0J13DRAFT_570171 [Dactylonectria estremocensis]